MNPTLLCPFLDARLGSLWPGDRPGEEAPLMAMGARDDRHGQCLEDRGLGESRQSGGQDLV